MVRILAALRQRSILDKMPAPGRANIQRQTGVYTHIHTWGPFQMHVFAYRPNTRQWSVGGGQGEQTQTRGEYANATQNSQLWHIFKK